MDERDCFGISFIAVFTQDSHNEFPKIRIICGIDFNEMFVEFEKMWEKPFRFRDNVTSQRILQEFEKIS